MKKLSKAIWWINDEKISNNPQSNTFMTFYDHCCKLYSIFTDCMCYTNFERKNNCVLLIIVLYNIGNMLLIVIWAIISYNEYLSSWADGICPDSIGIGHRYESQWISVEFYTISWNKSIANVKICISFDNAVFEWIFLMGQNQ